VEPEAGEGAPLELECEGVAVNGAAFSYRKDSPAGAAWIRLTGIDRVFQLGDSEVHALVQLDLTIDAGEYVAVMGPSGSGKSTLLNLLGLLDRPNAGIYRLEGRDVTTLSPEEQARVRSRRIGFVFQSFHLVPRLSAAENIALPMTLAGIPPKERAGRVARALADFGLENRADHQGRVDRTPGRRRPAGGGGHSLRLPEMGKIQGGRLPTNGNKRAFSGRADLG
jgi:ABC-type glutathione transport system ATPase component